MKIITVLLSLLILTSALFSQNMLNNYKDVVIAHGKMPNATTDKKNTIHIVYGSGDSIMYLYSTNKGATFTSPSLVATLPGLFASAMRGPQVAATDDGLVITACTNKGNIYSYKQKSVNTWAPAIRVNDEDEVAKEALMGVSADGMRVFAAWLAVKKPKGQNVFGATSNDGGKTWSKNMLVYASPESTVCECCKPSVAVKGNSVFVMFRNFLDGNRDLYVAKSGNGGQSFQGAQKQGVGNWKLNGCPMDGGGLAINKSGITQTVWRREGKIFSSSNAGFEKEIGEGKGCTIELVNNENLYAWTENGNIVIMKPQGSKIFLGKGSQPIVKAISKKEVICVWESGNDIHTAVLEL